jgi:hypothetical protein
MACLQNRNEAENPTGIETNPTEAYINISHPMGVKVSYKVVIAEKDGD